MFGTANKRLELHQKLLQYTPNAYFQPPSDMLLKYPAIVYHKLPPEVLRADNTAYLVVQGYQLTVIEKDPDSTIADSLITSFDNCEINNRFVSDLLHHTVLRLYF